MNIKNTFIAFSVFVLLTAFIPYPESDFSKNITPLTYSEEGIEQTFYRVNDEEGMPMYYFREVKQYPCKGEYVCRIMDLTLYFDVYGNYMMYRLQEGKELTKINHKEFSISDYKKLHKILNNENSELKYCNYADLTMAKVENQYHVDALSGATAEDLEFEYINGAIKTTYALWKIAHGEICDAIQSETCKVMMQKSKTASSAWTEEKLSVQQVWDQYQQADDYEKVLCLLYLQDQKVVNEGIRIGLWKELDGLSPLVYTGGINVLSKDGSDAKMVKERVLPTLSNPDFSCYMVAYNAVQRVGYNRLLRNYDINIWKPKVNL